MNDTLDLDLITVDESDYADIIASLVATLDA
jgi:hypothetical protein